MIETHYQIPTALFGQAWSVYRRAFEPLAELAVQRHLLRREEFLALADDDHIIKALSFDGSGHITGLSFFTRYLTHVDLISTPYFALRWPEEYAARKVWYVLFTCTDPVLSHPTSGDKGETFWALIYAMHGYVTSSGAGAKVIMDTCSHVNVQGMPASTEARIRDRDPGLRMTVLDRQAYRAFELS